MSARPKPNQPLRAVNPERQWVDYEASRYLAERLKDYKLTTAIHKLWDELERILLDTQRNAAKENKAAVCEAIDLVLTDLKMFADQGKLDLEYIKQLPPTE